ncbi:hypothetical protein [Ralstonia mojiangensis]|uniref:hypothetical protein n=1 Tax=Ralstonia mojiangensis TaxID=2953895 RepID=UPI0021B41639|nr:hypothetical protein [Ralstonia mojiangensis]MCT7328006.1 hypothetical protein [Ralstonia mojiangensis]
MGWGEESPAAYVAYCHTELKGVLENWAGFVFLTEAAKDIKLARQAIQVGRIPRRQAMKVLDRVQQFFDQAVGVSAAAKELRDRVREAGGALPECAVFVASPWISGGPPRIMATELLSRTGHVASEVVDTESALREHFTQLTSVVSIRESIIAQRKMERLTYATIAVAVASLLVAMLSVQDWTPVFDWLRHAKSSAAHVRLSTDHQ